MSPDMVQTEPLAHPPYPIQGPQHQHVWILVVRVNDIGKQEPASQDDSHFTNTGSLGAWLATDWAAVYLPLHRQVQAGLQLTQDEVKGARSCTDGYQTHFQGSVWYAGYP